MRNLKTEIALYREAIRHLWNSAFYALDESLRFGVCLELFEEIDDLIFRALVCEPLGIDFEKKATNEPFADFKVIPVRPLTEVPMMINRSVPASGYWDDPVKAIPVSDVDFAWLGFFDWDGYNVKDCAYYRVRIIDCKSHPDLIGRDALIEVLHADICVAA